MRAKHYQQSDYGKLNTKDAVEVVESLDPGADSAVYIALMMEQLIYQMKAKGADQFGDELAREVIAVAIASGRFTPEERNA